MRRMLLTGGSGFIGSALTERLLADDDWSIVSLDLAPPRLESPRLLSIKGDVQDPDAVADAMSRACSVVVHCAAVVGVGSVVADPLKTMRVNALGTANVLEVAGQFRPLDRVVVFSTSEVFGPRAFNVEEDERAITGSAIAGETRWSYAVSKLYSEHLAMAYHQMAGLPVVVVRPFNVYGGHQGENNGVLRQFVRAALNDEPLIVHGDGTQIRAWCYVDDMVGGLRAVIDEPAAVGQAFNIGNAHTAITIYGLANTIVRVLGSNSEIRFVPHPTLDVEIRIPNTTKARDLLGFEARIGLEEGIQLTADAMVAGQFA